MAALWASLRPWGAAPAWRVVGWSLVAVLVLAAAGCRGRSRTGELQPPPGAAAFKPGMANYFDDGYTRESVELSGRAPNDVLDQRLFAARLGHANVVAVVEVLQVFGRGRYQGSQKQFLDVRIDDVLMGELIKNTEDHQLIAVAGDEELPGSLQGKMMVLFLRWAPETSPPYHHHLMPAQDEVVVWIAAMIKHAQEQGVLNDHGVERKFKRRPPKGRRTKLEAAEDAGEDEPIE